MRSESPLEAMCSQRKEVVGIIVKERISEARSWVLVFVSVLAYSFLQGAEGYSRAVPCGWVWVGGSGYEAHSSGSALSFPCMWLLFLSREKTLLWRCPVSLQSPRGSPLPL
jgi:hypothetical protein